MCWNIRTASSVVRPVSSGLCLSGWYFLDRFRYATFTSVSLAPRESPRTLKESYITLPTFSGIQSRSGISARFLRGGGTRLCLGGDGGPLLSSESVELELELELDPEALGGVEGKARSPLLESWFLGLLCLLVQVSGRSGSSASLSMRHLTN